MAKNHFKIFTVLAVMLITLFALSLSAGAETKTANIFNIEEQSNMSVTLYYDVEEPPVSFIAPNGSTVSSSGLRAERGDKAVCYYIPNAMAGQWQMTYDKKSNSVLEVNWAPYVNSIKIESFDFTELSSVNNLEVKFTVSSDTDGRFSYAIYGAVLDGNGNVSGKKELSNGSGTMNRETTVRVYTNGLQPHDGYRLYLDVWRDEYGLEASDTTISASAFNVSGDLQTAIEDLYASVNLADGMIEIDWSAYSVRCDEYIIGVFDTANDAEPIYANSFGKNVTKTSVLFDKSVENLRIELSYIRNNKTSATLKKEIPLKTGVEFTFPSDSVTSSKQLSVTYTASRKITAHIAVNTTEQDISLEGSGSFSVNLDDFDNDVSISYSLNDDKVVYVSTFKISVDTIAPILLLPENDVTLFVESDTFDLAGAAETGCMVTVNGTAVTLNGDGTFVHTLTLADGENEFIVNARDKAGNAASQLIVITKVRSAAAIGSTGTPPWLKYLPLMLAFLGSIAVIAAVFLLTWRFRKDKALSQKFAVLSLVRNTALALLIPSALATGFAVFKYFSVNKVVNSEALFEIAGDSVSDAHELIRQLGLFNGLMIKGIILTAALCLIFAASLLLVILLKKRDGAISETAAVPDTPSDTVSSAPATAETIEDTKPIIPETTGSAEASNTEAAASKFVCPDCGAEYNKPVKFCAKCGHKFD